MTKRIEMGDPPSPMQAELLRFIYRYMMQQHRSPSWKEMRAFLNSTTNNAVTCLVGPLTRKGHLRMGYYDGVRPAARWEKPDARPRLRSIANRSLSLIGAPMKRTPMGLIPVVDTKTPAGLALLDVLSPRIARGVPA